MKDYNKILKRMISSGLSIYDLIHRHGIDLGIRITDCAIEIQTMMPNVNGLINELDAWDAAHPQDFKERRDNMEKRREQLAKQYDELAEIADAVERSGGSVDTLFKAAEIMNQIYRTLYIDSAEGMRTTEE